jgi:cell division protein FtsQ
MNVGRKMSRDINEYILSRKKAKKKKKVVMLSIVFIGIFILILFKAPFFNVKKVVIEGNKVIEKEKIVHINSIINKNIFYLNVKKIETEALMNPYIKNVSIKKKYPSTLLLSVKERKATYYVKQDEKFLILNEELKIMESKDNIEGMQLIELLGISVDNVNVGSQITKDNKRQKICLELAELLSKNKSNVNFSTVNISDTMDINLLIGEITVKIGSDEDMQEKLNKAINIVNDESIALKKGYINVSFKGNPVIKPE